MKRIIVDLAENRYDIQIEAGSLDRIGPMVAPFAKGKRAAIITDRHVDELYGPRLQQSLEFAGLVVRRIVIEPGEASKNLAVLASVYDQLADFGMTRSDIVVTLGGGVPGDLGGFAAATYLRGVPFVQVPTTLLAQIDSSVGGKVAIDLPAGKNLVGNFYQPVAVYIDPLLLQTLPMRYLHDGLAEAIKYGCIRDEKLFALIESFTNDDALLAHIEQVIQSCCTIKARIVEADEFDRGERMILNFGHTLGHAVETYYGYKQFTHGEGVAIGMAMLTERTEALGLTAAGTGRRLRQVLQQYGLPVTVDVSRDELLQRVGHDKKKSGNQLTLIILESLGKGRLFPIPYESCADYVKEGR